VADSYNTLRARLRAHALHAKYDSRDLTAKARSKFLERFLNEVDPRRELLETEQLRRAEHALRAHMTRLAMASAGARRRVS
jgi:hypothetical protein